MGMLIKFLVLLHTQLNTTLKHEGHFDYNSAIKLYFPIDY